MRSIGFYSFRGGVGRTNLLLNIAYHLARTGRNVGLLDLDLEAPGLTLAPPLEPAPDVPYPDKGLIDFLSAATRVLLSETEDGPDVPTPEGLFYQTRLAHGWQGAVHLARTVAGGQEPLAPVRAGTIYSSLQRSGPGGETEDRPSGEVVFRYLKKRLSEARLPVRKPRSGEVIHARALDFLLVDLRTGITELTDTAVGTLVDELVVVTGLNTQNVEGFFSALTEIADRVARLGASPVRVTTILSPVPNAELMAVRRRIREIEQRLVALAGRNGWFDAESPFQLLMVPTAQGQVGAGLGTVHYCDYLAVGDGVILEEYPETLTAREIQAIAGRFTEDLERLAHETLAAVRDAGVVARVTADEHARAAWKWVAGYWRRLPPWHWPLDRLSEPGFDSDAFAAELQKRVPEGVEPVALLTGLSTSVSLERDQKVRLLQSLGKLTSAQGRELVRIFDGEQQKAAAGDPSHWADLGVLIGDRLREWPLVLRGAGARLVPPSEAIERLSAGAPLEGLPIWATLGRHIASEDADVALAAARTVLRQEPPIAAMPRLLRDLHPAVRAQLAPDVDAWFGRQHLDGVPAAIVYSVGVLLTDTFRLHAAAEAAYRKAIELDPTLAHPWNGLGNLLKNHLGRYEEAEAAYRKAIELDPTYAYPWNGLGNLLQDHLGRYEEAEAAYRKAIELDPTYASPWNGLGNLLQDHLGRYEEAEAAYREALRRVPEGAPNRADAAYAHYNLLRLLRFRGTTEPDVDPIAAAARDLLSELRAAGASHRPETIHASLRAALGELGDYQNVVEALAERKLSPDDALWLTVLRAVTSEFEPPAPATGGPPSGLSAGDLESSLGLVAMIAGSLPAARLAAIREWLAEALRRFVPPPGSRAIDPNAIATYAARLGIDLPAGPA